MAMKLFVGLGNPGGKYKNNRHNVGFMLVDYFACRLGSGVFKKSESFESLVLKSKDIILAKPLTFMNESGKAVCNLANFYQVSPDFIFISYDDLDIPLGEYKIIFGKPPKTHNGVWSVIKRLKTKDFWHIRIGVENRIKEEKISGESYVLKDFLANEKLVIERVIRSIFEDFKENYGKKK